MHIDEYLIIFLSIIIGLGVADLALSFHRLLRCGRLIRWDWLTPAAALLTLALILNLWWAVFHWYQGRRAIGFAAFLPDVFLVLSLFLTAAAVLPDDSLKPGDGLRDFYQRNRRHFWWTFATYLASVMLKRSLLVGSVGAWWASSWENLVLCAAAVGLGFTRRVWAHGAVLAAWYAAVLFEWFGTTLG